MEELSTIAELRAAREGLKLFGLLGGFTAALGRFENAVRADERSNVLSIASAPPDRAPDKCASCSTVFNPGDTRYNGHGRYMATPHCRVCVFLCQDNEDAGHRCVICS